MQLTKWEYLYVRADNDKVQSVNGQRAQKSRIKHALVIGGEDLVAFLASVGEEGWELVSTAGMGRPEELSLIFKRPIQ